MFVLLSRDCRVPSLAVLPLAGSAAEDLTNRSPDGRLEASEIHAVSGGRHSDWEMGTAAPMGLQYRPRGQNCCLYF